MLCGSPIHCSLTAFVICTLVLQVPQGHSAPLTVTGPPGPITVAKGEDVVLPCSFSPGQNAQDMEVTWFREQFSPFVHRYKLGQDQYGEQMLQYQGRTGLRKDGFAKGSADLKIFHVRLSDTGSYTCFVKHGSDYDEAVVELKVTASGSAPLMALERYEHGGIRVSCRSAGWYPRPRVLWHDPHGRHLPSLSENATQDKNGLFAAESSWAQHPQASGRTRAQHVKAISIPPVQTAKAFGSVGAGVLPKPTGPVCRCRSGGKGTTLLVAEFIQTPG
ncbi:butyrophilin subfamily 1 member A1-like isoform X2 [Neopelma chrysocephalum]|uniref:butyrophilin subfamily 1 member A1-like isoform X2 n=1 Tax=Neopelma chrysocephalum TaxID=114329 RepID=UPI000FCD4C89|nr:butyrophilin subfamily 1 member A1-like isoform X2 [Neopelma chrysocephalum]